MPTNKNYLSSLRYAARVARISLILRFAIGANFIHVAIRNWNESLSIPQGSMLTSLQYFIGGWNAFVNVWLNAILFAIGLKLILLKGGRWSYLISILITLLSTLFFLSTFFFPTVFQLISHSSVLLALHNNLFVVTDSVVMLAVLVLLYVLRDFDRISFAHLIDRRWA